MIRSVPGVLVDIGANHPLSRMVQDEGAAFHGATPRGRQSGLDFLHRNVSRAKRAIVILHKQDAGRCQLSFCQAELL